MATPTLNWNLLDEQWRERHLPEVLSDFEQVLDRALFQNGDDLGYPLLWRWARLSHFRAMQAQAATGANDKAQKIEAMRHFEAGATEAARAMALQPHRVEGFFWHGTNALEAARLHGKIAAGRALSTASKHIERAMNIDENYHFAGPVRVWGRITHFKPLLLGGSVDRALDIYRRALQIAPHNSTTLLFYAQALHADRQKSAARKIATQIIEAPDDLDWRWEQNRDRQLARELIADLDRENK